MYADKITDSMRQTIDETARRRTIQLTYNEEHGITPQAIVKARNKIIGVDSDEAAEATPQRGKGQSPRSGKSPAKSSRQATYNSPVDIYTSEFSTSVDIAADPVVPYMSASELERAITSRRAEMVEAAKRMDFIEAARLRDEIVKMEEFLKEKSKVDAGE